jgi:four helix bundle protein
LAIQDKVYDLEERTAIYAERIRDFCQKNSANNIYIPQLLRSSSSPGSNYIEANENLGEKDFKLKIKACRKESRKSAYWLPVITSDGSDQENERKTLRQEAKEFILIFTTILKTGKVINF